ncbi:alpha/beta-hydrolase, partial [Roridomyces roridus]
IRYAAPPTGNLRWRAPQLPSHVSGIQNATQAPLQCFQSGALTGTAGTALINRFRTNSNFSQVSSGPDPALDATSTEDCLFLNVHTPTFATEHSRLPVIVYLHGGGYDAGNISLYPTQDFATLSRLGVVAVSVQYRLGVFGFLAGEEVKEGGNLNVGLLDQNFALQWVQKHISVFRGDPNAVTIWGQSAGAGAVLQHVVAHGGNTQPPLFRAALANSPYLPFQYAYNDPITETLFDDVASFARCDQAPNRLDCLRSVDPSILTNADTAIGSASFMGTYTFVPVVDGSFIVERPSITLNGHRRNGASKFQDSLLVTTNSAEGASFFVFPDILVANNFTLAQYITQLFPRLSEQQVRTAVSSYSKLASSSVSDQATKVMGEAIFTCPAYWMAAAFGKTGWKAEFAIPPGLHAEDLSYDFFTFAIPPTFTNAAFLDAWRQSFISIAISLDPNIHSQPSLLPIWADWVHEHTEMMFNKTEDDVPVVNTAHTGSDVLDRC